MVVAIEQGKEIVPMLPIRRAVAGSWLKRALIKNRKMSGGECLEVNSSTLEDSSSPLAERSYAPPR